MQLLDLSLATAAENVALDEALLDEAEEGRRQQELLRLWEFSRPTVILGRSSRIAAEVHVAECQRRGIDIVRRTSGGAAVAGGPGCLMYSLLLSQEIRPELRHIDRTHEFVLGRIANALSALLPGVAHSGISDLSLNDRKFSGNSLRCKRHWLLYHGTLLYDFPLSLIGQVLATAPRPPAYRRERNHAEFVTNVPLSPAALREALIGAFDAREAVSNWPANEVERLVRERFGADAWTWQR